MLIIFFHDCRVPPERDFFRRNGLEPVDVAPADVEMCVCRDHDTSTVECGNVNQHDRGKCVYSGMWQC